MKLDDFKMNLKKVKIDNMMILVKSIKSRKTDDAIGIQCNNNKFILGDKKVYFNNNIIKIGKIETNYTIGLEQLTYKINT